MADWTVDTETAEAVEKQLWNQVDPANQDTEWLLADYFDEDGGYSGAWFERIPEEHGTDRMGCHDLVAVTMLGLHIHGLLARDLLYGRLGTDVERKLGEVPPDSDLWSADETTLDTANDLWVFLRARAKDMNVPLGDARLSKLLARKWPRLIPITDSVVMTRITIPRGVMTTGAPTERRSRAVGVGSWSAWSSCAEM